MANGVFVRLKNLTKHMLGSKTLSKEEEALIKNQKKAVKRLSKLTKHNFIRVTSRGNVAIFTAMYIAKKKNPRPHLLIPDQGGWITFKKYPQFFNFNVKEVKTYFGIIDLDDLEEKSKNASALIITSFAGYFAEQPIKEISRICSRNGCLLIEDASGALGDKTLCNGKYSDIIVGSFESGDSAISYGGFISTNSIEYFEVAKEPLSLTKVYPGFYKELLPMLTKKRLNNLLELAEKEKKILKEKGFNVIHHSLRGINIVAHFNPGLIVYCNKKDYSYTLCPDYTRVNEKAVSIEFKRLKNEFFEKDKGKKV